MTENNHIINSNLIYRKEELDNKYKISPYENLSIVEFLQIGIHSLELLRTFKPAALNVFSVLNRRTLQEGLTYLSVEEISTEMYGDDTESNKAKVRRGIRELILKDVIAKSDKKNLYWVNRSILWVR